MPLAIPAQQEVARETSIPLLPKNWASHLQRWECQVVRIGKKSPQWQLLKDKVRKSLQKQNIRKAEDQSETLRGNKQLSWLAQFIQGRLRGRRKSICKEEPKLSPSLLLGWPAFTSRGGISLCLPNRTELETSCNTGPPFQIFAAARQNQGNYTLPQHIQKAREIDSKILANLSSFKLF